MSSIIDPLGEEIDWREERAWESKRFREKEREGGVNGKEIR